MSIYLNSIKSALFIFIVASFIILFPAMIIQYRKYGSVSTRRSIILYAFLFYMIAAYCLVISPLPNPDSVSHSYREMMQLVPFTFIRDFFKETVLVLSQPSSYIKALTQGVVIQPLFNIFLTIPFGMFLRYYFNRSVLETIIASLLLSLFFELTQLSGLYFIYPGPYRLFDVDDLLLNTLGGFIGYYLPPLIRVFFPSREELDKESYIKGQEVTYIRRLCAYSIDLFVISIISGIVKIALSYVKINSYDMLITISLYLLYFAIVPALRNKATLGQRLVKIKVCTTTSNRLLSYILRIALVYITFNFGTVILNPLIGILNTQENAHLVGILFVLTIQFSWFIFMTFHIIYTSRHGHKLYYETLSKTYVKSTIEVNDLN